MDRQRDQGYDSHDVADSGTAEALRELGWVFTLGALPLLVASLHPEVFQSVLLSDLPSYSFDAQRRFFVLGLVVLLMGVIGYFGGTLMPLLKRRRER